MSADHAEVSSQPPLLSLWGTQTKHSGSSETGIEISLKSMDFKILVVHGRAGMGGAPLLLQKIRGGSVGAVTAQRGTGDGQMDTAGLGRRSSGSGEGMVRSPIWEDGAIGLVGGGQGAIM